MVRFSDTLVLGRENQDYGTCFYELYWWLDWCHLNLQKNKQKIKLNSSLSEQFDETN